MGGHEFRKSYSTAIWTMIRGARCAVCVPFQGVIGGVEVKEWSMIKYP